MERQQRDKEYLSRKKRGRGLIICWVCVKTKENSLGWYGENDTELFLKYVQISGVIKVDSLVKKIELKENCSKMR